MFEALDTQELVILYRDYAPLASRPTLSLVIPMVTLARG